MNRLPNSLSRHDLLRRALDFAWMLGLSATLITGLQAREAEEDLRIWAPMEFIHPLGEDWSVSLQVESRVRDNVSEFDEVVYKPAVNYHFKDWVFSAGYKHNDKYLDSDEDVPWQEVAHNKTYGELVAGCQLRIEERFIDGLDGVLPRLRLLTHAAHPLGESTSYLTSFGELRFNLDDKGEGPVDDFEQSRIFAGLGRHLGDRVLLEAGYLWRYKRERTGADGSDHAIRFHLVINSRAKGVKKPSVRDRYR